MAAATDAPTDEIDVNLFDMVLCFARAIDFLHPAISEHHLRAAYVASCLAEQLGFPAGQVQDIMIAGALHDIAAVCAPACVGLFDDALAPGCRHHRISDEIHRHGMEGYLMLQSFAPFANAASAIRFHHVDWEGGRGREFAGEPVPFASHILRLADQVAILPEDGCNILEQVALVRETIVAGTSYLFNPDVAGAFEEISSKESFWLDMTSKHKEQVLRRRFATETVQLDVEGLHAISRVFGKIIDYRSSFTAAHSSGVAATSEHLAARLGMPAAECRLIGVAGYLHDIGKLAVPPAILDKPDKLTQQEMFVIRQHPYHTHQILSMVPGLERVSTWASLHHERLDGTGYPFRPSEIPLGARIIAVADVFTAITEHRPYRRGMDRIHSLAVLDQLAFERALDGDIVAVLSRDFEQAHHVRSASQQQRRGAA